jgi:kumamolisin
VDCSGWCVYGGASVASPLLAGLFNAAGFFYDGSDASLKALTNIYQLGGSGQLAPYLTDIDSGLCGPGGNATYPAYEGFDPQWILAVSGIPWSYCAGWGSWKDTGYVISTSRRNTPLPSTSLAALSPTAGSGSAQISIPQPGVTLPPGVTVPPGSVVIDPDSSGPLIVRSNSDVAGSGFAHTNTLRLIPRSGFPRFARASGPPVAGDLYETPASLACIYLLGVGGKAVGCNPNQVTTVTSGGSHAIALVDAYDYPTAAADLATYDSQFGLAPANLTVVYGAGSPSAGCTNGPQPGGNSGWNIEAAIDIEMAHAMAPQAQIYLVEAASNSFADLFNAVQVATACVVAAGGGEVSMSFGGAEFSGETSYDSIFTGAGVVYFAAAGDSPGVEYPSSSPNVIGVGGTTIARNPGTGTFESEATWNWGGHGGTGGGPSSVEGNPSYQSAIAPIMAAYGAGNSRGVPDLAVIANPETGVWIYSTACGGWCVEGGASVATAVLTGIFNFGGYFYTTSFDALSTICAMGGSGQLAALVSDIDNGLCGPGGNFTYPAYEDFDPRLIFATTGIAWNFCAGWGTPKDEGNPNSASNSK